MIKYIGKCLLIEKESDEGRKESEEGGKEGKEKKERVLVIGDIHLGAIREIGGVNLELERYNEMIKDLDSVFEKVGTVYKIILLGDLKDDFSRLKQEERDSLVNLFDYLEEKCKEIIVIRGNHDNYLLGILKYRDIEIYNYYIWKEYCFLHGDEDFSDIYKNEIRVWVMGHLHPAISLREDVKEERYKCFLEGEFKGKKVIILPSFIDINEGVDVRLIGVLKSNLAWKFNLKNFEVKVVGERMDVFDFGVLDKIRK